MRVFFYIFVQFFKINTIALLKMRQRGYYGYNGHGGQKQSESVELKKNNIIYMKYLKKLDIKLIKGEYKNPIKGQVRMPEQVYEVFSSIKDRAQETLICLYLNNDLEALAYNILSTGSQSETTFDFNDLYGYGFVLKAKYFILAHNHPSGDPLPSKADKEIIRKFADYGKIDLKPLDFIIIGDKDINKNKKDYWSMFEEMDGGEYGLGASEWIG